MQAGLAIFERARAALSSELTPARGRQATGPSVPPGWRENPSAWRRRLPTLGLATVGLGVSTYLTLAQVGVIRRVWDPIFGSESSEHVLHSVIERYIKVPDSALGVLGYLTEIGLDSLGGEDRWRTAPAAALGYGATIGSLGAVSLALVIMQGVVVRHWCALCLSSAATSGLILALGYREALAAAQYVQREVADGEPFWPTFWGPTLLDLFETLGLPSPANS